MQKGGVGKTTVAVNLAAAMAGTLGLKTYLADFDAQCNATTSTLGNYPSGVPNLVSVMRNETTLAEAAIQSPHHERLFVIPSSKELASLELAIARKGKWDVAARELPRLVRASLPEDADVLVIDTPPSLGLWLQVALGASDEVIIIAKPEEFSVQGVSHLVETVQNVREGINTDLRIAAVMLNGVRPHTREHAAFISGYEEMFGNTVLQPYLPERIVIPASQRDCIPLEWYDDPGAREIRPFFQTLARRILESPSRAPAPAVAI